MWHLAGDFVQGGKWTERGGIGKNNINSQGRHSHGVAVFFVVHFYVHHLHDLHLSIKDSVGCGDDGGNGGEFEFLYVANKVRGLFRFREWDTYPFRPFFKEIHIIPNACLTILYLSLHVFVCSQKCPSLFRICLVMIRRFVV